jgi:hypothetical protein
LSGGQKCQTLMSSRGERRAKTRLEGIARRDESIFRRFKQKFGEQTILSM